jgi:hypothetical protein
MAKNDTPEVESERIQIARIVCGAAVWMTVIFSVAIATSVWLAQHVYHW